MGVGSRARPITMIKSLALISFTIMLAAERYTNLFADVALAKNELLEVHRSKISLHRAKENYTYPTIRLPHHFFALAGLPTRIYQTVQLLI